MHRTPYRNDVLSSHIATDHMRQVRAEIGRRLREYYDAGKWPMSDRLAIILRKIQRPNGLCEESGAMSKPDQYRANAQECERMAAICRNPSEKATWLQMAQQWLGMIPKAGPAKPDPLDAAPAPSAPQTKSEE